MLQGITGEAFYGKQTQNAGTLIQQLVRPFRKAFTKIMGFRYTAGTTAHVLTWRMEIGRTTLSADAASGQTVINLTAQPTAARNIAANDFVVIEGVDQTQVGGTAPSSPPGLPVWDLAKVSSVSGLAVTLTANVARAYRAGSVVWLLSLDTDTVPGYGGTNPKFDSVASTALDVPGAYEHVGLLSSVQRYSPLLFESANGTAAGTLEWIKAIGWDPISPRT